MSAGKGSAPRNCFTQTFRDNYDAIFQKKDPDADISTAIRHILATEPDDDERHGKLFGLSMAKAGQILAPMQKENCRTVPPHPKV
jgi:hypothetical protein